MYPLLENHEKWGTPFYGGFKQRFQQGVPLSGRKIQTYFTGLKSNFSDPSS
jgi:hypothetical protein